MTPLTLSPEHAQAQANARLNILKVVGGSTLLGALLGIVTRRPLTGLVGGAALGVLGLFSFIVWGMRKLGQPWKPVR